MNASYFTLFSNYLVKRQFLCYKFTSKALSGSKQGRCAVPNTEPLTLAHPAVQAAKARWDAAGKRSPRKHTLTFEDLFEYFKVNCVRQTAIAVEADLTHQRIYQIYNYYFRELFGNSSGRDRVKSCTLEGRLVVVKKNENELLADEDIKVISEKARDAGCIVSAIPSLSTRNNMPVGSVLQAQVSINGHRCLIRSSTRASTFGSKRLYCTFSLSHSLLEISEAVVFYTHVEGFPKHLFVVPSSVLLAAVFGPSSTKKYKNIYIPVEKLPPGKMRPRINYWQYEDAWHLLPPKQD